MTKVVFTSGERRLKVLMKQSADAIEILERAQACQFFLGGGVGKGVSGNRRYLAKSVKRLPSCAVCVRCVFLFWWIFRVFIQGLDSEVN